MKVLEEFFKNYEVFEINKWTAERVFEELSKTNENKYTPLHYVADKPYPVDKAVALIKVFLQLGVDPNKMESNGGYSFVHLALYSEYELDFFKKVLPIAIDYSFNVNIKDDDGDSIVHTAIYSEDYFGEVTPFFELLGENFDIRAVNKKGKSIKDALEESIIEAEKNSQRKWLNRLTEEKEKVISKLERKKIENKPITSSFYNDHLNMLKESRDNQYQGEIRKQQKNEEAENIKYQAFLEKINEKMDKCSSLDIVTELLEIVDIMKEDELKEELHAKLVKKKNLIEDSIVLLKEWWSKLTSLADIYPNNEAIKEKINRFNGWNDNNEIDIANINFLIDDIKNTINNEINAFIINTAENIKEVLKYLDSFQPTSKDELVKVMESINDTFAFIDEVSSIVNRSLTEEVKELIKIS